MKCITFIWYGHISSVLTCHGQGHAASLPVMDKDTKHPYLSWTRTQSILTCHGQGHVLSLPVIDMDTQRPYLSWTRTRSVRWHPLWRTPPSWTRPGATSPGSSCTSDCPGYNDDIQTHFRQQSWIMTTFTNFVIFPGTMTTFKNLHHLFLTSVNATVRLLWHVKIQKMFTRLQYVKMEFPQFSSLTQQLSRVPSSVIHNFYLIGCGVADTDLEIFDGQIITTSEEQKYLCRAVGNLLRGGGEKNNTSNVMYSNTLLLLTKNPHFFRKKVFFYTVLLFCSQRFS